MLKSAVTAAIALACMIVNAEARPKLDPSCFISGPNAPVCVPVSVSSPRQAREVRGRFISREVGFGAPVRKARGGVPQGRLEVPVRQSAVRVSDTQVVGGRPIGCPARFCGCGASLHLFGKIIPSLNLAANWLRFPRAAPAPKMVAARRGHVFVLEEHISGDIWLAYDSNSGGHQTRLHARSISGYSIVNPHG